MWTIAFAEDDNGIPLGKNRIDAFRKRRPDEFRLMMSRAQSILSALNSDYPIPIALNRGWVHPERGSVFAIDPGRAAFRMYCYLDGQNEQLLILTIGDKKSQQRDNADCARWAKELGGRE